MTFWQLLMEILLLLGSALVLGAVAQRLKQSAIIGYLLAGMLMGPLLFNTQAVKDVAELGVALLLFSIGLEFSYKRLKHMGKIALGGGSLQVVMTMVVFAAIVVLFKPFPQALALGAIAALSSTAVDLRMLVDRIEIDAGANTVVDEEDTVGRHLANEVLNSLELGQDAGLACALAGRSPKVTATSNPK